MAFTLAVRQRRRLTDGRCDDNGSRPQASRLLPRATATGRKWAWLTGTVI